MLQRAATNAYSWWWASHIRTKQSKWMEQNIQDMEEKVGVVLKLISEDGDSFAKRAEMYYKKRPELIGFVEESFKAYRALAERYDHISKELQNANNTIASVFPEQVQFSMEEEDERTFRKMQNKMPTGFIQNAPPVPKAPTKDLKSFVRLATKKLNPRKTTAASAFSKVAKSGLSKKEGVAEIDKLQKQILVLQTEKEFVKSSYDTGVAKYWQIDESIKGLQEKVGNLQDEFGEGKVIEDEEARHLMMTTALNSCKKTLDQLQEKQDKSSEETIDELKRIMETKQKLRALKCGQTNSEEPSTNSEDIEASKFLQGDNEDEIQMTKQRIKEQFDVKSFKCLTVSEMADTIDELVNKVVGLETAVSSETAMLKRLRTEADEIQCKIKIAEDDNANLINENNNLKNKLKEMEEKLEKLLGVQELNETLVKQNEELQMQVTEARRNVYLSHEDNLKEMEEKVLGVQEINETLVKQNDKLQMQVTEARSNINISHEVESLNPDEKIEANAPLLEEETSSAVSTLKNKLKEMEEKLLGVQELNETLVKHNEELQVQVTEANRNFDLYREVESIKPDEEKIEANAPLHEEETSSAVRTLNDGVKGRHAPEEKCAEDNLCDSDESQSHPQKSNEDNRLSESVASNSVDILSQETETNKTSLGTVDELHSVNSRRQKNDQEELDWKQLYLNGLQDRDKVLLIEYTTTFQNYKDVKKQLDEIVQKTRDSQVETSDQLKELKIANALKDEEIKQLREKLSLMQRSFDGSAELREFKSLSNEQNSNSSGSTANKSDLFAEDNLKELFADQFDSVTLSPIEEKFRADIDELLEENLDFWLKFSASFHEIQKFETEARDLQEEAAKLFEKTKTKSEGSSNGKYSLRSDARPLYKHLIEIQTELAVWLEKSTSLKEEQKSRFSSLCEIREEITKTLKECAELDDFKFTSFQAAKFQGEILNMKQENNKVAEELQAGIDHVTSLHTEVEQSLTKLNEEFGLSGPIKSANPQLRRSDSRNRIPLRSFIFGVKPKKQKASIFNIHKKCNALKL